jgi:hypothetical protein
MAGSGRSWLTALPLLPPDVPPNKDQCGYEGQRGTCSSEDQLEPRVLKQEKAAQKTNCVERKCDQSALWMESNGRPEANGDVYADHTEDHRPLRH